MHRALTLTNCVVVLALAVFAHSPAANAQQLELGNGFVLALPYTRPINVVTNGDWEGSGVQPDIAVPESQARHAAHLAALKTLPASAERDALIRKLDKQ